MLHLQSKHISKILQMEDDSICGRLKFFMEQAGFTSSQFADKANIPRPSFSQLLSGRNKKISDEIFRKLHEAFPQLSIPWLMFGEGDAVVKGYSYDGSENMSNENSNNRHEDENLFSNLPSENSENMYNDVISGDYGNLTQENKRDNCGYIINNEANDALKTLKNFITEQQENKKKARRVVRITVFYDDASYESFGPMSE